MTVDIVIPRLSPVDTRWEVALIRRKKQPYRGAWALPGGHVDNGDSSLEAAARREAREETGLDIPLHLFQQVQTYEDFADPRGKYLCLLYVIREPLAPTATIQAGDDASYVQWFPIENLNDLPYLAFNHIRLLRTALRQFFTSYYRNVMGFDIQEGEPGQCEMEHATDLPCPNTAYWRYHGLAVCPKDMLILAEQMKRE